MSRPARDLRLRRWQLYRRAAPVFARFGYRDATIKATSDLSGIVLTRARRASSDPLSHLRALIVHSLEHREYLRIAADIERLAMKMVSITRASILPGMERSSAELYDDLVAELRHVLVEAGLSGQRFSTSRCGDPLRAL
ncbi:MAG TPA: hypothetical protein VGS01_10080 [Candidatus Limnocylindria bacterium]|jgi:hypothetical protein|nr:hypothetical protein [Candidatus Limnocylindria bacterium]